MSYTREWVNDRIDQINAIAKKLQDLTAKQFAAGKESKDQSPQEKFKVFVLKRVLEKAEEFYQEERRKFKTASKGNPAKDKFLKQTLQILRDEFLSAGEMSKAGRQQNYIDEAIDDYLHMGNNGITVNKTDVNDKENAVYLAIITLYGRLLPQRLCLEEHGNTNDCTDSATNISNGIKEFIKNLAPEKTETLNTVKKAFNVFYVDLVQRFETNSNSKSFELTNKDPKFVALINQINAKLFNSNKSTFITKQMLDDLVNSAKKAAQNGDQITLLQLQKKAKAIKIWMSALTKKIGAAIEEYKAAMLPEIKKISQQGVKELQGEKDPRTSSQNILDMTYIVVIMEQMLNAYPFDDAHTKEKNDYDWLMLDAKLLVTACTRNAGAWFANNPDSVSIQTDIQSLVTLLRQYVAHYQNKREQINLAEKCYTQMDKEFDRQVTIPKQLAQELDEFPRKWEEDTLIALSTNCYRPCEEVLHQRSNGLRSFFKRHWGKMTITGVVTAAAMVAMGLFLMSFSWPLLIAVGVAGLLVGAAVTALGAKIGDMCCGVEPTIKGFSGTEEEQVDQAAFLLGIGLQLNQSSSATVISQTGQGANSADLELDKLDNISEIFGSMGEVGQLSEVVVNHDQELPRPRKNS